MESRNRACRNRFCAYIQKKGLSIKTALFLDISNIINIDLIILMH